MHRMLYQSDQSPRVIYFRTYFPLIGTANALRIRISLTEIISVEWSLKLSLRRTDSFAVSDIHFASRLISPKRQGDEVIRMML